MVFWAIIMEKCTTLCIKMRGEILHFVKTMKIMLRYVVTFAIPHGVDYSSASK